MKTDSTGLYARASGLGFAFDGVIPEAADPEKTIFEIIQAFESEPKLYRMLLSWLERAGNLVHVERLKSLAGNLPLSVLIPLGALAMKQEKNGDRRFRILSAFAKEKIAKAGILKVRGAEAPDPYLIEKYGTDEEFMEFGMRRPNVEPSDPKKILTIQGILKLNSWLRMRTLIGANYRADLAYLMTERLAKTPYQAAKILGCSNETAYRLWKELQLYTLIDRLAG